MLGAGIPKGFARDLMALPRSPTASEARDFIERHRSPCAGSGVGWADVQILVAAVKAGARIYSSDTAVRRLCRRVGLPPS